MSKPLESIWVDPPTEAELIMMLDAEVEAGVLIKEGNEYRVPKAVCLRCNIRIQNSLKCMTTVTNKYGQSVDVYTCPRCLREELLFEGYKSEENPEHDNFDRVWEYAHDYR